MIIDTSRFKYQPLSHQLLGVEKLVSNQYFALFDEMGSGKTKQVIDAACLLFEARVIDTVVVIAPSAVRQVWLDRNDGEIQKHCFSPWLSYEFHRSGLVKISSSEHTSGRLAFVVTNYEYLRREENYTELLRLLKSRKFLLVLDEGAFVKNSKAQQTKSCFEVRKKAARVVLLNGSPYANTIMDLYSQIRMLHPSILDCPNQYIFRNRYCKLGGYMNKQIVGVINKDDLDRRIQPFVLRRLKKDCIDLPDKIYNVLPVPLSKKTWELYTQMRDDMVAWLDQDTPSIAAQAIVKTVRLAQLASGWLGGVGSPEDGPVEVGNEKIEAFMGWLDVKIEEDPNFRVVVWCRFYAEQEALARRLASARITTFRIYGGQNKAEREHGVSQFMSSIPGPQVMVGNPQAGGFGLNFIVANHVVYMSNDYALLPRMQSEDRCHRQGQTKNVYYLDIVATGPNGQKTINHATIAALRRKEDMAAWTVNKWRQMLLDE